MKRICLVVFLLVGTFAAAQVPPESVPSGATVKQLMVDLVYPASNDILLSVYRGAPQDEKEWAAVRRSALTLAEAGNLLALRARGGPYDPGAWIKDAKTLADVGAAAYKAAQAKDAKALTALAGALDASCTTCHKQYRPDVFPRPGGSK